MTVRSKGVVGAALVLLLALVVSACGTGTSDSTDASATTATATGNTGIDCGTNVTAQQMLDYTPPRAKSEYEVALMEVSLSGYYYQAIAYGAQKAAEEAGVKLTVLGGKGYQDPSQQVTEAEDLINRGTDGIVLAPVDPRGSAAIVENASAQDVPVVNISSNVVSENATKILQNDYQQGQTSARELIKLLPKGGEGIVMGGPANGEWSNLRVQGFEDELAKHPQFKIATVTHQEVEPAEGLANFEGAVQAHPDPKWIYSVYAYVLTPESIPSRYSKVPYVTTAYEPMVIEALENGSVAATIANDPVAMGKMGVGQVVAALNGEPAPKGITCLPNTPLDKSDIESPVANFELYPESYEAG